MNGNITTYTELHINVTNLIEIAKKGLYQLK